MKIIIDSQDDLISIKEGNLSNTILEQIEPLLYSSGKMIEEISFNEESLDEEDIETTCAEKNFTDSDVLTIKTKPLLDHLLLIIDSIDSCLVKAEEDAIEIAENILKTDNTDAMNKLAEWSGEISELIINLDNFLRTFNIDLQGFKLNNKEFNEAIQEVSGFLNEINSAIEGSDKTTIADLIEFEVSPIITGLKELMPIFKTRLKDVFEKAKE